MLGHARRFGLLVLVLGMVLLPAARQVMAQQNSPFYGTWELDRFNSVFEPITTAPQKQIMTLAPAPMNQFTATTRTWRGEVANETAYTAAADGRDYPTTAAGATVAFKMVNNTTWERTAKLRGEVAETATWEVSADGKMLTIKRQGTDALGNMYSSTAYYTKVQ